MDWDDVMRKHEESLASAFKVVVRLGECRHMVSWHGTIEDGAVGKILPVDPRNGAPPGHTYWVWFDRPISGSAGGHTVVKQSHSYSAAELIPISIEEILAAEGAPSGREG